MRIAILIPLLASPALLALSTGCTRQHPAPASVNSQVLNQQLLQAAREHDADAMNVLLKKGADIHTKNDQGETVLSIAAYSGEPGLVASLLKRDFTLGEKNHALFASASQAILVAAYDPAEKTAPTPAFEGHRIDFGAVASLLIKSGANVEAREDGGERTLIRAASLGVTSVVQVLLDAGADVNARSDGGGTALIAAACDCAVATMPDTSDVMKLLLDKGAEVDAQTISGDTALIEAAATGQAQNLKLLLDRGAKIDHRNKDGETALMYAARGSAYSTVGAAKLLLDRGSKIDLRNHEGKTALMLAASGQGYDSISITKVLIRRGADVAAEDDRGETALTLARKKAQKDIVRILTDATSAPQ